MTVSDHNSLEGLKEVGSIVGNTIRHMLNNLVSGMETRELDMIGFEYFRKFGAKSAPVSVYKFPGQTCISVNEEVAHGIPGDRVIQGGDKVNIDVSLELNGFFADAGYTVIVPPASETNQRLCEAAESSLMAALKGISAGKRISETGRIISATAKTSGFPVIKNLSGHGTGRALHEEPYDILNYQNPEDKRVWENNSVVAIETFVSEKNEYVFESDDGWTLKTREDSVVAQFEHTIVVTEDVPVVLTLPGI